MKNLESLVAVREREREREHTFYQSFKNSKRRGESYLIGLTSEKERGVY